jgi:single-stranded-DNA-specific exonuclease
VRTILRNIENQQKITIYGDYDADGLTATALLVNFFRSLDIPVSYYIPNRITEGYGFNGDALRKIASQGRGLVITVDCGISNRKEIELAKGLGLEILVTDHHQVPGDFEPVCPVVNPHQADCLFPFKDLAGVGLAFFLAVAIRAALRERGWFRDGPETDLRRYLDLVALGTIADNLSLLGQNRILVSAGLEMMEKTQWPGIRALKDVTDLLSRKVTVFDAAFKLAPRLNAPGRLGDPEMGIQILTTEQLSLAKDFARRLDATNTRRQDLERSILAQIDEELKTIPDLESRRTIFMAGRGWHKGVLGILAARLLDRFCRPSFVMDVREGMAVGSARSVDGFNLYRALNKLGHIFERFGGHAYAAGFTLKADRLVTLEAELESLARNTLSEENLRPTIEIDCVVASFEDLHLETVRGLMALSPFGAGNPEPLFLTGRLEVMDCRVVGERHLRLRVRQGDKVLDAIGFGLGDEPSLQGKWINMVYHPQVNRWDGYDRVQLKIIDFETSEKPSSRSFLKDAGGKIDILGAKHKEGFLPTGQG